MTPVSPMKALQTTTRMYEYRDHAKRILGDRYPEELRLAAEVLITRQIKAACDPVDALILELRDGPAQLQHLTTLMVGLILTAACVELYEGYDPRP